MRVTNLLDKSDEDILNKAVHSELYASQLYRHISNQMQRLGLFGTQKFFAGESADELTHYQRIADFLNDSGTSAKVPSIEACDETFDGLADALELGYDTELQLKNDYESWYKAVKSVAVQQFLLQFIEIQRLSVGEYGDLLARLDLVGDDKCGIVIIDQELGEK